jgi:uncharacterized protein with von Willebrand factor type A (vWA) domain
MQEQIIEFANVLRRNGVRVSLSENVDAFRAVGLLGLEDPALFRSALRSTLVKRTVDLKPFDELFDFFFLGIGQSLSQADHRLMEQLGLTPPRFQQLLESVQELLGKMKGHLSKLTRALLSGDNAELERLLREAVALENQQRSAEGFRFTPFTRMAAGLGMNQLQEEIERFKEMLQLMAQGGKEEVENIFRYVDQRLTDLYRMIRVVIEQEQRKQGLDHSDRNRRASLSDKSFSYYTEEDIRRMNETVALLAQRLKNRLAVRRKKAARGRFDVKETLRKNLQFGGIPFRIELDRRQKTKPQVVILCDISDSVMNASRFMLQFVYSVQDLYSKVRSFVFVSDIGEVTQLFEDNDIQQAVEAALRGDVIDVYSHSNFGRAFELFYKEFFPAITSKTTFVIIGDGRNNYNRPSEWVLREIKQKAKRVVWLNPENPRTWGVGDSEMPRYLLYCDIAEECRNINQLYKVIDRIVP